MLATRREPAPAIGASDPIFATVRAEEFARLDEAGLAYLDYTGSALPAARQLRRRCAHRVRALDDELRVIGAGELFAEIRAACGSKLFAFPAQSNFSGVRHPLELIDLAHGFGFDVLVDAAAFLPSRSLSLRALRPAFVALSFYKLFGYPSGLGALVARRDALACLSRPWFSGGTVEYASVQNDVHSLLPTAGGFEDGTPHFLGAAALPCGFALLAEVGMVRISGHVTRHTD